MFLENCEILENKLVAGHNYLMKVKGDKTVKAAKAGQFYMLQCKNGVYFLRRPISLHYADKDNNILEFYYEIKGGGTKDLASMKAGEIINIQGPLGTGFTTEISGKELLVVGGGMGMAPMKLLIEVLSKNNKVTFIAGGRNREAMEIMSNFNLDGIENYITTDDGSVGIHGNVIVKMEELMKAKKYDMVFTCGPQKMMEAVAKTAKKFETKCEISLEARMACGVKACVGCSIKTKFGMKKVCHDGPVFDSETIIDFDPVVEKTETCCGN